jgi:hypothetical protein
MLLHQPFGFSVAHSSHYQQQHSNSITLNSVAHPTGRQHIGTRCVGTVDLVPAVHAAFCQIFHDATSDVPQCLLNHGLDRFQAYYAPFVTLQAAAAPFETSNSSEPLRSMA